MSPPPSHAALGGRHLGEVDRPPGRDGGGAEQAVRDLHAVPDKTAPQALPRLHLMHLEFHLAPPQPPSRPRAAGLPPNVTRRSKQRATGGDTRKRLRRRSLSAAPQALPVDPSPSNKSETGRRDRVSSPVARRSGRATPGGGGPPARAGRSGRRTGSPPTSTPPGTRPRHQFSRALSEPTLKLSGARACTLGFISRLRGPPPGPERPDSPQTSASQSSVQRGEKPRGAPRGRNCAPPP